MSGISAENSLESNPKINSMLLLANNVLFALLLACPMIQRASRYFANTYLCLGIILLLSFLNYRLYKAIVGIQGFGDGLTSESRSWKLKAKILAWAALVPAVMLLGVGPITNPSAYTVDKFTRIFGVGVINDYSVSNEVHYFYFALIIYGLLAFNFYLNIILSLGNNFKNKIRRLGEFSDTLLFVGWSFLLVCAYRQFSRQYGYDLTLYLLKSFMVFMIPAFFLWERGKLKVQDVRVMLALALFSLVLSLNILVCFDTRSFGRFSDILATVLLASVLIFIVNRAFRIFDSKVLYSKIIVISLAGSFALAACSLVFEFTNILALKTERFIDAGKILRLVFYAFCYFALGWFFCVRRLAGGRTAGAALFVFVLGVLLVQFQPSINIRSDLNIFESANYAIPINEFFSFGKIPLFENFPGHGLSWVISSIAYGAVTSDYSGAIFAPWYGWLFSAACGLVLYCFIRKISNGLAALSAVILIPYLIRLASFYALGLAVFLPFIPYVRTLKKRYLILTVITAVALVAYKLDVGFASIAAIVGSSFFVSILYRNKIIYQVLLYLAAAGAAVFALFLLDCLIKDINPLFRIQQYLSVVSSNDHWGRPTLGDTEKNAYSFFYFAVPVISAACFLAAAVFRKKFTAVQFALLCCLLSAYYANLPRILVRHSLAEYRLYATSLWLWTFPLALAFLISRLFSGRSLYILCQTAFALAVWIFFQPSTLYENAPVQNAVSRADRLSDEVQPDTRKKDISAVFSRGSRVVFNEAKSDHLFHADEIKTVADLLLSPGETYLDFTNLSAAYAWSGREDPAYVVQPPSMLSGEKSQRLFIQEAEPKLEKMPIAIMPANRPFYLMMYVDGINNNIRHYLIAEWIYRNYRPLFKYNDFASVWVLNSRYDEFRNKLGSQDFLKSRNTLVSLTDMTEAGKDRLPGCHNCTVRVTDSGLLIQPAGHAPFIDLDGLVDIPSFRSFNYLTLYLAQDRKEESRLFFSGAGLKHKFSGTNSMPSLSVFPNMRVFDLRKFRSSVGEIDRLRLYVPERVSTIIRYASISTTALSQISPADWGYDNFVSLPKGTAPDERFISNAHDYRVAFLPYIWGQFDRENAAGRPDLAKVSRSGSLYSWNYSGNEQKPAYLRVDLSASAEFMKKHKESYLILGDMENGKYTPLVRFRFKLKEGKKVYLFRISSDYYWSRGKLNALSLAPDLENSAESVRILEGD